MFGQQQQQQQGAVPQIFMNPWDPSQAPVMTLAPLANVANAMQAAYHQQMLLQQQASYCLCGNVALLQKLAIKTSLLKSWERKQFYFGKRTVQDHTHFNH